MKHGQPFICSSYANILKGLNASKKSDACQLALGFLCGPEKKTLHLQPLYRKSRFLIECKKCKKFIFYLVNFYIHVLQLIIESFWYPSSRRGYIRIQCSTSGVHHFATAFQWNIYSVFPINRKLSIRAYE